ncbi:MAG TPA: S41 family peptidase [Candidatus Binatia bacterium]|jgi:C-terminal peptidase prc
MQRTKEIQDSSSFPSWAARAVRACPSGIARPWRGLRFSLAIAALLVAATSQAAAPASYPALSPGLSLLERNYLYDSELVPAKLFDEAGKVFSRDVSDLVVRRLSERAWLYRTPDCELRVEVPADATVRTLEAPLTAVGRLLESCSTHLPPQLPAMDSYLLGGVLSGLDPYSVVFDEKHQNEHNIQYQGKLAGIGARIGARHNQLTLIEVYPDSPAARADLRNDDAILRIDDLSTKNIAASDAVERIRGDEGTTVTLLIQRKDEPEPKSVIVTRGIVMIPSVKSKILDADILYTEITQFSQTTPDDFRQHLKKAVDDKHLRGVIIDLRRNSGGSMMGSSAIGDLFLKEGVLITTAGRDGQPARGLTPEVRASGSALSPDLPVIFLTSPMTASGSELLAASLRNNDRALLVGEHTFGKGCIQKTFPLRDTSTMKMTVGNFLPNAQPIPGGGLIPDVEVTNYKVGSGHLAIPPPIRTSELPFWLKTPKWSKAEAAPPSYRVTFAQDYPDNDPSLVENDDDDSVDDEKTDADKPDRVVEIAAAILRNHGNVSAKQMLADSKDFLEQTVETSEADLGDFMYKHGMDWTDGPRPQADPHLTLQVLPVHPLRGGEDNEVDVRITNNSPAPFYRVRAVLDSTSSIFDGKPAAYGRIEPGSTRSWRMKVKPLETVRTGRVRVTATLYDDKGELAKLPPVDLVVMEAPRPHLAVRTTITASAEDPTHLDITLDLENRGNGAADKIIARLKHPSEEQFEILEGTGDVASLAPGEKTTFVMKAHLLSSFDKIPDATIYITETHHGLYLEQKVPLTMPAADESAPQAARTTASSSSPDSAAVVSASASAPSAPPTPSPAGAARAATVSTVGSGWNEAPRITIEGIDQLPDNTYQVRVRASDDHALAEVRARIDDDTVAYVEPAGEHRTTAELRFAWKPDDDVKKLRIEAVDDEGLREYYAGSL